MVGVDTDDDVISWARSDPEAFSFPCCRGKNSWPLGARLC